MQHAYEECLKRLYHRNVMIPAKMGLESTIKLYNALNRPLDNIPILHVAGTNGKGSVCYKSSQYLQKCGLSTGLFVSPHISSYRERVMINNKCINQEEVVDYLLHLEKICDQENIPATVFEMTTALSMLHFHNSKIDIAVIEVGLGGRLDATNVITPEVSVITSIQKDHTHILGSTLEEIAYEKGGIIKENIPIVVGPECPHDLLQKMAIEKHAPFYTLSDFPLMNDLLLDNNINNSNKYKDMVTDIFNWNELNDPDVINSALAGVSMQLLADKLSQKEDIQSQEIAASIRKFSKNEDDVTTVLHSRPPCRYEHRVVQVVKNNSDDKSQDNENVNVNVILDVAHNGDAINALCKKIKKDYNTSSKPIHVVVGISKEKKSSEILPPLINLTNSTSDNSNEKGTLWFVQAQHPRAFIAESLWGAAVELGADMKTPVLPLQDTINAVLSQAAEDGGVVLICGSFYIMSAVRAALGIIEPRDSQSLNDSLRAPDVVGVVPKEGVV